MIFISKFIANINLTSVERKENIISGNGKVLAITQTNLPIVILYFRCKEILIFNKEEQECISDIHQPLNDIITDKFTFHSHAKDTKIHFNNFQKHILLKSIALFKQKYTHIYEEFLKHSLQCNEKKNDTLK